MYTVIKEDVFFEKKGNKILVYKGGCNLTSIKIEIYTVLTLFNGSLNDREIIVLFSEIFHRTEEEAERILKILYGNFSFILEKKETVQSIKKYNIYLSEKRTIDFERVRSLVPKKLVLSLTKKCFMKCRYCYAGAEYQKQIETEHIVNLDLIERIIKEAKALEISHIDLTGGDPFVRNDLFAILDLLKKYNMTTSLSTKKKLTDEEIDKLGKYENIISFQISLDTLDDNIEKILIGEEGYSKAILKVIDKLVKKGLDVKVNSVITGYNIDLIIELTKKLEELGVKTHVLSPYSNNLGRNQNEFFPPISKYKDLFKKVDSRNWKIKIDHPVLEFIVGEDKECIYKEKSQILCTAGLDGLIIGPDGEVCICERLLGHGYSLGNILNSSLMDIWNSIEIEKYYNPPLEAFRGTQCYECEEREYCLQRRGICYVHSLILNKKIFSPDNFCLYDNSRERIY